MKKLLFALFCCAVAFGDNALRVGDTQRLEFSAVQNAYDEYKGVFVAFDKGASILQSYEKLAKIHAIVDESDLSSPNDADGCACLGLKPTITPFKDFNHHKNTYVWRDNTRLVIERECWGGGEYFFELKETNGGVQITTKFSRDKM